jgi:hypothetical protein
MRASRTLPAILLIIACSAPSFEPDAGNEPEGEDPVPVVDAGASQAPDAAEEPEADDAGEALDADAGAGEDAGAAAEPDAGEVVAEEPDAGEAFADDAGPELAPDAGPADVDAGPPPPPIEAPPNFGQSCTSEADCPGGICFEFGDGRLKCTLRCTSDRDCPIGALGPLCNPKRVCKP